MVKSEFTLESSYDGLDISVEVIKPENNPKGIVQFSHGMAEHKERYEPFMEYLAHNGYITVIHDHRGHGKSIKSKDDLGYFYAKDITAIVEDLYQVTRHIKFLYPNLPLYMFSHSMGTLVARNYIKTHDDEIEKLVLCGPPTENKAVGVGLFLDRITMLFHGEHYRSKFIDGLATGKFNEEYESLGKNAWICSNETTVNNYNNDELCGYRFTTNGFYNLFKLQQKAFSKSGWLVKKPNIPIFMIAGAKDPVISSEVKFNQLKDFLMERGYKNISTKLYEGKRHELLNEKENHIIFSDVLQFLQNEKGE